MLFQKTGHVEICPSSDLPHNSNSNLGSSGIFLTCTSSSIPPHRKTLPRDLLLFALQLARNHCSFQDLAENATASQALLGLTSLSLQADNTTMAPLRKNLLLHSFHRLLPSKPSSSDLNFTSLPLVILTTQQNCLIPQPFVDAEATQRM